MEILDGLTSLDLSSRQAKVYLALLQRGSASAIELAKSTGFKHPTVYDVLDSLKERNLISECYTGSKRRFTAENPEVFREQEARRMSSLEAILPSLLDLYQSGPRRPVIRVYLYDENGERFFGEGPLRLLHAVEETGSLRSAAQSMEKAYTKALHLLRRAEKVLGFAFTRRTIGGRGGGGSVLTDEAKEFMQRYESYRDECVRADRERFARYFADEK